MDRNYGKEIDNLQKELDEIKAVVEQFIGGERESKENTGKPLKRIHMMNRMHPDKRLSEKMAELCTRVDNKSISGMVTYMGVFESGGQQSNWIRNEVSTDDLLRLIENKTAAKVLTCIGNNDRLNILLSLLRSPKTVTQLVEQCGYSSTGQVYYHLRPLIAADLVCEDEANKSYYLVRPHRVQGIIMLLAGISDMVDPHYTLGIWEE